MKKLFDSKHSGHLLLSLWVLGCFAISVIFFAPGFEDNDTDRLIGEGQSGFYTNFHSVLVAFVLQAACHQLPQFSAYDLMFLTTMSTYWLALGIIALVSLKGLLRQCSFVTLAGFFPSSFLLMLPDNRDSLMCPSLLLAYGYLLCADSVSHRVVKIAFVFAANLILVLVTGERHNGFIAAAPLCTWSLAIAFRNTFSGSISRSIKAALLGTALSASFAWFGGLIGRIFLDAADVYPSSMLMIWDLTNLSIKSGEVLFPKVDLGIDPITLENLKPLNCEDQCDPIFWGPTGIRHLKLPFQSAQYRLLERAWLKAIAEHPDLYIEHRTTAFLSMLGMIYSEHQIKPYLYLTVNHAEDHTRSSLLLDSPFNRSLRNHVAQAHFLPIPPFLTSGAPAVFLLVFYAILSTSKRLALSRGEPYLVISALVYAGTFFLLSVGSNQRYMTYPISVSILIIARIFLTSRYTFASKKNIRI